MQTLKEVSGPKDNAEFVGYGNDSLNSYWTDVSPLQVFLCCSPSWWCGQVLTDANFPESERLWEGSTFKFLGSGVYYKKILFIRLQVYLSILRDGKEPCSSFSSSLPGMAVLKCFQTTALWNCRKVAGVCSCPVCRDRHSTGRAEEAAEGRLLQPGLHR